MRSTRSMSGTGRRGQGGLSLVELMIAMLLGIMVAVAAGAIFLSNKRAYGSGETLNRIQEGGRAAFEIMSRDLREAGGNPCSASAALVNQLISGNNAWWQSYAGGLRGYSAATAMPGTATGTATAQRVAGTDAIDLHLANEGDARISAHATPTAAFTVNATTGFAAADVLLACNMEYVAIFQATSLTATSIAHAAGNVGAGTGNCGAGIQWQRNCAAPTTLGYCFMVANLASVDAACNRASNGPAQITRVNTARWYIGNNARGGTSLYRADVVNRSGTATPNQIVPVEIAEGVTALSATYFSAGGAGYQAASTVADWGRVISVRVELTFAGTDGALTGKNLEGTDDVVLSRTVTNVVALRNREGLQ